MPAIPPRTLGLAALFLLFPLVAVAADPRAAVLADACAACHGTDGQSPGVMPSLQGRSAAFIAQRLKEFKTDQRQGTVMNRLAKGYSDADIALLAKHFEAR